jgi:cytochrome c553
MNQVSRGRRERLAAAGIHLLYSTFAPKSSGSFSVPAGSGTTGEGGSVVSTAGRPRATHSTFLPEPAALIDERCGGWCEIQLGDFCWGLATEYSHRITQKAGGRHGEAKVRSDRTSNALKACHHCHHVITATPWKVDAHANGWVLEEWQEPTQVPVLYRGDLVYLDDAGDKHSYEEAGA